MARQPPGQRRAESDDQRQRNYTVAQRHADRPRIARGEVKVAPLCGERQGDEGSSNEQQGERADQRRYVRTRQAVSRLNVNQRTHTASNLVSLKTLEKAAHGPAIESVCPWADCSRCLPAVSALRGFAGIPQTSGPAQAVCCP